MRENYYALLICILRPVTLEKSFDMLAGNITKTQNKSITAEDVKDMIRMKKEGMTYQEISEIYGMSWDAVRRRIKRYKEAVAR